MADSAQKETSHDDVDNGFGDVDVLFIVAHEAMPAYEPDEGSLDRPPYNVAKCGFEWSVCIERPSRRRQLVETRHGWDASRFVAGESEPPQDLMRH